MTRDRTAHALGPSQRVRDLLDEAQDLLRHRSPDGALETIFEQALELLVAREKKRKFGQTDKPRMKAVARPAEHSRYVPPDMRREVYARVAGSVASSVETGSAAVRVTGWSFITTAGRSAREV